jgi:hypothetical protein
MKEYFMKIYIKKVMFLLLLFVIGIPAIFACPVLAYSIGDYHWDSTGTTYDMSALTAAWQTQVASAACSWNDAGANFAFSTDEDSLNPITQEYMPDEYGIGISSGQFIYGTAHWYSCWMKFNTRYSFSTDGSSGTYDIQSIAVHELGHWLKLNDVYFWPWESKVMYYSINTGTIRRALQQDDINGINAMYP